MPKDVGGRRRIPILLERMVSGNEAVVRGSIRCSNKDIRVKMGFESEKKFQSVWAIEEAVSNVGEFRDYVAEAIENSEIFGFSHSLVGVDRVEKPEVGVDVEIPKNDNFRKWRGLLDFPNTGSEVINELHIHLGG